MSSPLGRRFFHDRLTDQASHHVHLIVSVFTGVALASAALTILAILGSPEALSVKLAALALWGAGFAAVIASYDGIMVGSIIDNATPNVIDVAAPFVMGLAEYIQFAVLVPLSAGALGTEPSTASQLYHLTWWPLVAALFNFSACITIGSAKVHMRGGLGTAPVDVRPLLSWYLGTLGQAQLATGVFATVMLGAFFALHYGPAGLRAWQAPLGVLVMCGMSAVLLAQESARREIVRSVTGPGDRGETAPGGSTGPTGGGDDIASRVEALHAAVAALGVAVSGAEKPS